VDGSDAGWFLGPRWNQKVWLSRGWRFFEIVGLKPDWYGLAKGIHVHTLIEVSGGSLGPCQLLCETVFDLPTKPRWQPVDGECMKRQWESFDPRRSWWR